MKNWDDKLVPSQENQLTIGTIFPKVCSDFFSVNNFLIQELRANKCQRINAKATQWMMWKSFLEVNAGETHLTLK